MRAALAAVLGLSALAAAASGQDGLALESPHGATGRLYKGQLHCHSRGRDGSRDGRQTPEALLAAYREAGYDFVVLTDHLVVTAAEAPPGLTLIPGSEVHTRAAEVGDTWGGHHVGAIGIASHPRGWDRSSVAAILSQVAAEGGLAMANHPRLRNRWSADDLAGAAPLQLVSIFNGRGYWEANRRLPGSGGLLFASQSHWDAALARGRVLWGVAADDCHDVADPAQFDQGWVRVRAASAAPADLRAGLRRGDLYACRGPAHEAPPLEVVCRRDEAGAWEAVARSAPGVVLSWLADGAVVAEGRGPELAVAPPAGAAYLRAEARDPADPDARTYGQPVFVVRGPRLVAFRDDGAWVVAARDAAGRAVAVRRDLPLRDAAGAVRATLPAGVADVRLADPGGRTVLRAPRGWGRVTVGR